MKVSPGVVILWVSISSLIYYGSAICSKDAISSTPANDIPKNGCLYGACQQSSDQDPLLWRCVHDSSFCFNYESFVEALDVVEAGRLCTCKDILDFPSLIGACNSNGVFSPMIKDEDCSGGEPVCESSFNADGAVYDFGFTGSPFTSCDLNCFHGLSHAHVVKQDTYQQCAVPAWEWAVASSSSAGGFTARDIVSTLIDGKSVVIIAGEMYSGDDVTADNYVATEEEVTLKGPYTASDPSSVLGSSVSHDVKAYGGRRPYDVGFGFINGEDGTPIRMVSIEGEATQYINAMAIGGPGLTAIAAGGDTAPLGNLRAKTKLCTPVSGVDGGADTICETDSEGNTVTTLKGHAVGYVATLFSLSAADYGSINWMIQPWLDLTQAERDSELTWYSVGVTGLSVDTAGNIYVYGHKATQAEEGATVDPGINGVYTADGIYVAVVSKFNPDGEEVWRKEFTSTQYAIKGDYDANGDALFVTFEMPEEVEQVDELGVKCENPAIGGGGCSILARMSAANGTVEWVRFAHGNYNRPWNVGGARIADSEDGPYVYAAFQLAGVHGPTTLDAGSSYGGCKADDGTVVPEYDESLNTYVVNQIVCTQLGLGAFFSRASGDAIPAYAANTGSHCTGSSATSCLAKFNKHNGLPIWGTPKSEIFSFQTQKDGVVAVGSTYSAPPFFDTVQVAGGVGALAGYGVNWQSKIDRDGNGVYVQTATSEGSYGGGMGITQDPNGDLFITQYTVSPTTRLGPGTPGGFTLDLSFDADDQHNIVSKLGIDTTPYCVSTCGNNGNDLVVTDDTCYIDGVCYEAGDSGAALGVPCLECNPILSQTEWKESESIGTTGCFIGSTCYNEGDPLEVAISRYETAVSECQACIPSKNGYNWSVKDGYSLVDGETPPNDCAVTPVSLPVSAPVVAPVVAPVTTPFAIPVITPVVTPVTIPVVTPVTTPVVAPVTSPVRTPVTQPARTPITQPVLAPVSKISIEDEEEEGDGGLSTGAIVGIVVGSAVGVGILVLIFVKGGSKGKATHGDIFEENPIA